MDKQTRFFVTKELGKLAKWLRILGFDAEYSSTENKSEIIISSLQEFRIILTRNKNMGARKGLRFVYLRSDFFKSQLKQIIKELQLPVDRKSFFSRCVLCNKMLKIVEKGIVKSAVPEYVYNTQDVFHKCSSCGRIYWKGTHWGNADQIITEVLGKNVV